MVAVSTVLIALTLCCYSDANMHARPRSRESTARKFARIDRFAREMMKCRSTVPGLSLAIVHKGKSFSRGYGFVNVEDRIPTKAHHSFPIGSLTKSFTSTLLALMLANNNKGQNWDTTLKEILGESFQLNTSLLTQETSIRDLLAHKTGIPSYFEPLVAGYKPMLSRDEAVRRLRYLKPTRPFRSTFSYSNHLYMLAGYIAEKLAGNSTWEDLVREMIFKPLGMTSSGFVTDHDGTYFADPYVTVNGSFHKVDKRMVSTVDPLGPAGSVKLSARDAVQWMKFHLHTTHNPNATGHSHVMDTYEPCNYIPRWHPLVVTGGLPEHFPAHDVVTGYGLGWVTNLYRGMKRVSHSGNLLPLYSSQLWLYPKKRVGIYSVTNGPTGMNEDVLLKLAIHYYASDILTGKVPWLNSTFACSMKAWFYQPPAPSGGPKYSYSEESERKLLSYVGTFGHLAFGNVTVYINKTTNEINLIQGEYLRGALFPSGKNTFTITPSGSLNFWRFADGMTFPQTFRFANVLPSGKFGQLLIPMEDIDVVFERDLTLTDISEQEIQEGCTLLPSSATRHKQTRSLSQLLYLYVMVLFHVHVNT